MPCDIFLPRKKYDLKFDQISICNNHFKRNTEDTENEKKTALACLQQNPEYIQFFQQINFKKSNGKREWKTCRLNIY